MRKLEPWEIRIPIADGHVASKHYLGPERRARRDRRQWQMTGETCFRAGCGKTFSVPKRRKGEADYKPICGELEDGA